MTFLKVCGLREPANLRVIAALRPTAVGLIFSPKSPRYAGALAPAEVRGLPAEVRRIGVFVDAAPADVLARAATYGLNAAQLHGTETPETCAAVRAGGLAVVKAVRVDATFSFAALTPFVPHVAAFLFDAPGPQPGGNGVVFDWQTLAAYPYAATTPWLLAGGLTLAHVPKLQALRLPGLAGFDINSGFETAPGLKDVAAVRAFLDHWPAREAAGLSIF